MRADAAFAALRAFPIAPFERLAPTGGLVIVAPHPDDESLGCGGLIAQAVARGRDVRIVIVSDGTGSHPASKTHPKERLRDLREDEARAAARVLGVAPERVSFLRLPDRYVPTTGADADRAACSIARLATEARATSIFTTSDIDPHCDHKAAFAIAREAALACGATLWTYVIWGWTLAPDVELPASAFSGVKLDITAERALKRRAVAQHVSQLTALIDDDPTAFRLTDADVERCCAEHEIFREEALR